MEGEDRWLSLSLGTSMNPLAFQQYRRDPPSAESVTRIDVNRIPTWNTYHDDVSSRQSGKRQSSESEEEEEEEGENTRKKLRLSKEQSAVLEESFKEHTSLNPNQKLALAKKLNLRPRQVEVWFQNRRARTKLKQTEVDREFLKRCCENLTKENRRLQRELLELRAMKRSPHFYMQVPTTALTICPSCERLESLKKSSQVPYRKQIRS
ncbi:homeobox-leucine zipper protein HAT4-like isoform X1 [Tasmannia lanceolata]|uniref:homeobox-leucine zipper protein HAT4-like isoform X1 n=1 Tax=Tasmannia lanceolata TaxID=3420 RepID=UPI0040640E95